MKWINPSFWFIGLLACGLLAGSCQKELHCEDCGNNHAPLANAGPDQAFNVLPDSVVLNGTASTDAEGPLESYRWTNISGPSSPIILQPDATTTVVKNFAHGIYSFQLEVTDSEGLTDTDTIQLFINTAIPGNQPPVANAGADQLITTPASAVSLDGSASFDPDNNIITYNWIKISGPSATIATPNAALSTASGLVEGLYMFTLTVTDAGGLQDTDTMTVTVENGNAALVDVYVTGSGLGHAKYWKNGQEIILGPDEPGDEVAVAITMDGTDIFVAGDADEIAFPGHQQRRSWKNGQPFNVGVTPAFMGVTSIAVSGNDVYISGWETPATIDHAVYWKNGQKILLSDPAFHAAATEMTVIGTDLYIVGYEYSAGIHSVVKYWKNGQPVSVTNGTRSAIGQAITVVGNDIYIAGIIYEGSRMLPAYWKNGQEILLNLTADDGLTSDIVVVGNDVYVTGSTGDFNNSVYSARYWKNGQEFSLPNGKFATAIAVFGNDVYIAGISQADKAVYWKNGQQVLLPNGYLTTDILVKPR